MVGLPGIDGLSTEQRKWFTIAVELVANPSIIFMDEPTSGLDARAAAIVMRTVTVDTGRTVVCTVHQPSIDIFEAFDELFQFVICFGHSIYWFCWFFFKQRRFMFVFVTLSSAAITDEERWTGHLCRTPWSRVSQAHRILWTLKLYQRFLRSKMVIILLHGCWKSVQLQLKLNLM